MLFLMCMFLRFLISYLFIRNSTCLNLVSICFHLPVTATYSPRSIVSNFLNDVLYGFSIKSQSCHLFSYSYLDKQFTLILGEPLWHKLHFIPLPNKHRGWMCSLVWAEYKYHVSFLNSVIVSFTTVILSFVISIISWLSETWELSF